MLTKMSHDIRNSFLLCLFLAAGFPSTGAAAIPIIRFPELDSEKAAAYLYEWLFPLPPLPGWDTLPLEERLSQLEELVYESGENDAASRDSQTRIRQLLVELFGGEEGSQEALGAVAYRLQPDGSLNDAAKVARFAACFPETPAGLHAAVRAIALTRGEDDMTHPGSKEWQAILAHLDSYPLLAHEVGLEFLRTRMREVLTSEQTKDEQAEDLFTLIEQHAEQSYGVVMRGAVQASASQVMCERYKDVRVDDLASTLSNMKRDVTDAKAAWAARATSLNRYPQAYSASNTGGPLDGVLAACAARIQAVQFTLGNVTAFATYEPAIDFRMELVDDDILKMYFGVVLYEIQNLKKHVDLRCDALDAALDSLDGELNTLGEDVKALKQAVAVVRRQQTLMLDSLTRIEANTEGIAEELDELALTCEEIHKILTINPEGGIVICSVTGVPVRFPLRASHQRSRGNTKATTTVKLSWTGQGDGLLEVHVKVKKTGTVGKGYAYGTAQIFDKDGNTLLNTLEKDGGPITKHKGSTLRGAESGTATRFYTVEESIIRNASYLGVTASAEDTWGGLDDPDWWKDRWRDIVRSCDVSGNGNYADEAALVITIVAAAA